MSNRTLIEINHDYSPGEDDAALLQWAKALRTYIRGGDKDGLPSGVEVKWRRHHSDPCPFDQPLAFELRFPRRQREAAKDRR